jgi:hypothetical protein
MEEIFALEINLRPAEFLAEPPGVIERRWTAGVVVEQVLQLRLKFRRNTGLTPGALDILEGRHQGLGDETSPVRAEMALRVGL